MRKTCILVCISILSLHLISKNYYVASHGSDSSDGTSPQSPLQSINKINTLVLNPGDSVLFNKGDQFRGNLHINYSGDAIHPIYIGSYGMGTKPVISGATHIQSWQQEPNGVFSTICESCPSELSQVFVSDKPHIPSRFPNKGYLKMSNVTPNGFEASQLPSANLWDSAYLHVRTKHWIIDRFLVKKQQAQHIEYTKPTDFYTSSDLLEHYGFFISGKLAALDTAGEWFYNSSDKKILIIPLSTHNLNTYGAEVSTAKNCITLANQTEYIHIENLKLEKSLSDALFFDKTQHITISNCHIRQAGRDGIGGFEDYDTFNSNISILNCTITDINNTGINMPHSNSLLIQGNTVKRCGLTPGLGQYYDQAYSGILCNHARVINNKVDSIGYLGISFKDRDTIMYNTVSNVGLTKIDCGAYYCWSGSYNYVAHNYAFNVFGNGEGTTHPHNTMSVGLYCDDYSHHNTYEFNTSYNNEIGLMLHNAAYNEVRNNIMYNNTKTQIELLEGAPYSSKIEVHSNIIRNNVFQLMQRSQLTVLLASEKNNISGMATWSGNLHGNHLNPSSVGLYYRPLAEDPTYTSRYASHTLSELIGKQIDMKDQTAFDISYAKDIIEKTSSQHIQNATFEQNTGWWWTYDNDDFTLSTLSGYLGMSNRVLKGNYADTSVLNQGNWGVSPLNIKKGKKYMLTYQVAGVKNGGYRVNINSSSAPYSGMVAPSSHYKSFSTITKSDTIIVVGNTDGIASLSFNSTSLDGSFVMDNVHFFEIEIDTSQSKPFSNTVLFTNASNAPKLIHVADKYQTLEGIILLEDITLAPYESVVLNNTIGTINTLRSKEYKKNEWHIYPNPTSDKLNLISPSHGSINAEIEIIDMGGRTLYNGFYDTEGFTVPEQWGNGLYFIRIKSNPSTAITKFVLNR